MRKRWNNTAAIKLDSSDWEPHYELGAELDAAGQTDAACDEFGAAARLTPGSSRTHLNYGVLLAKLGRLAAARREFEESLRIEPTYAKAHQYLAQVETLERRAP